MSKTAGTGLVARSLRKMVSITLNLGVLGASAIAILVGAEVLASRAADVPPVQSAPLTKVSVVPLVRQPSYMTSRRFVGQVEPRATLDLSFERGGRLTDLQLSEGDHVEAGQILARLDTSLLEADEARLTASRAAIAAQLTFAETRLDRATKLREDGFASQDVLDQAITTRDELQNRIAEIDASLQSVRINLEKSVLIAPFSGQIGAQFVDEGVALNTGQAVASLMETARVEVRVGLPLDVTQDALGDARIDIAGAPYPARLIQLRPDIDPVTRTRTALFAIDTDAPPVFGQTATLLLENEVPLPGAWVQIDALQESTGAGWSVLVVDDGVVRPAMVDVLHAEQDRAFVRGTFEDGALLIRTGAHRVVPGQSVDTLIAGS